MVSNGIWNAVDYYIQLVERFELKHATLEALT